MVCCLSTWTVSKAWPARGQRVTQLTQPVHNASRNVRESWPSRVLTHQHGHGALTTSDSVRRKYALA
jgi:hypothetical protein